MPDNVPSGILDLYGEAVPDQFFQQIEKALGLPARRRIFSLPLVVWLMISQRLYPKATLSVAVQQVVQRRPRALLSDHKRIREGTVSCHTGAYSDARQAMPVVVAEKVADRVLDHLMPTRREALPGWKRQVFILDGSTLELPHTPELVKSYPPASNQHGTSHWPVLQVLVAQELTTGLAGRPCWGPMYGPKAVGEQSLTEQILDRLPDDAVVMGDINFGVFSVAFAIARRHRDMLLRLKADRAGIIGQDGPPLTSGTDRQVCWRPSRHERNKHPHLPADACVQGRLIVQQVKASNGDLVMLYLFTTLDVNVEQLLQLYGDRWNVETDLRSLKQTLNLQMLTCKSDEMIAKELLLAITGYNLVRAVMNVAAQQAGLNPRRLSFSRSQDVVYAALAGLETAGSPEEFQIRLQRMYRLVASCKLPDRSHRPSTPRQSWGHSRKFPKRQPSRT